MMVRNALRMNPRATQAVAQRWDDETPLRDEQEKRVAEKAVFDRQLQDAAWDVRMVYWIKTFLLWLGWRNVYRLLSELPRKVLLGGLFFSYYHWRGRVSVEVRDTRLSICRDCPSQRHRERLARAWWFFGSKKLQEFCDLGCAPGVKCPDTKLSALSWKTWLHNWQCPRKHFGRGDLFPQVEKENE